MKKLDKVLFVAAFAAVSSLAGQASAQYQATDNDGITASPKLRQQLNERNQVTSMPSMSVVTVGYVGGGEDGVASPKLRQQLAERKAVAIVSTPVVVSAGYQATGADGITASPKLRQQLDERGPEAIMIAPLR